MPGYFARQAERAPGHSPSSSSTRRSSASTSIHQGSSAGASPRLGYLAVAPGDLCSRRRPLEDDRRPDRSSRNVISKTPDDADADRPRQHAVAWAMARTAWRPVPASRRHRVLPRRPQYLVLRRAQSSALKAAVAWYGPIKRRCLPTIQPKTTIDDFAAEHPMRRCSACMAALDHEHRRSHRRRGRGRQGHSAAGKTVEIKVYARCPARLQRRLPPQLQARPTPRMGGRACSPGSRGTA